MKSGERDPVFKATKVLTWIVEQKADEIGVREIATGLGISPSTTHRLLADLVNAGLVRTASAGRYALSLEFFRLAYLTTAHLPIRQIAMHHMQRLTAACNETTFLGLYDSARQEMMFAAMVESTHPLRYSISLNQWIPVHLGASGLGILSFLDEAEANEIMERTRLAPATSRSVTERYKMEALMAETRERGYAITRGHRIAGAVGFAAPIFDSGGKVMADICLTIPESRFDEHSEGRIAELLIQCADEVTRAIGGRPYHRQPVGIA